MSDTREDYRQRTGKILNTLPPLPYKPESLESMIRRYPEALNPVVNYDLVLSGTIHPPSKFRKHVFDFGIGIRMIADRHTINGEGPHVHVSCSTRDTESAKKDLQQFTALHTETGITKGMDFVVSMWFLHHVGTVITSNGHVRANLVQVVQKSIYHYIVSDLTEEEIEALEGER